MPKRPNIAALIDEQPSAGESKLAAVHRVLKDENQARILLIPIDQIEPNPDQPRKHFDAQALADLEASIREKGILQPIIVRKKPDSDRCVIIAGERRFRAAKRAGVKEMPALIRTDEDHLEIAIIENLQRENLSPLEEAEALAKLKKEKGYTLEQLGRIIGKSKPTLSESLKLLELPEDIQTEVRASSDVRTFPKSQLLQVVSAGSPEKVRTTWETLKRGDVSTVRELRHHKKAAQKKGGRPTHYRFDFTPEDHGNFHVSVIFSKKTATRAEVRGALKDALKSLAE